MLGTEMFTKADASITGSDEPGLLMLYGYLRDGVSVDEAEKAHRRSHVADRQPAVGL